MILIFRILDIFLRWLIDEMKMKQKMDLDHNSWTYIQNRSFIPQQENTIDCGIFVMMYADFLADDLPLDFTQKDIITYRKKIAASILRKKIK